MLNEVEVDINAPPLDPYRDDDLEGGEDAEGGDEEEEDDDDEDITEIQEEAFTRVRSSNYTDAEDILLVRAWASVGLMRAPVPTKPVNGIGSASRTPTLR
jgi:hypothetical protein